MMNADSTRTPHAGNDANALCTQCAHFYITHDVRFPYGCHALGFKSRQQPCREVLAASGEACAYFERKRPADPAR